MRYSKPKEILKIVESSSIGHILRQSQFVEAITTQINRLLPKTFQGYYVIKNYDDNSIVIAVANGTIRYGFLSKESEILMEIQKQYPAIKQIKFVVDPNLM